MMMEQPDNALDALAEWMGIEAEYYDVRGELMRASTTTKHALLAAMGVPVADEAGARAALREHQREEWCRALPPVLVLRAEDRTPSIAVSSPADTQSIVWRLAMEGGGETGGEVSFADLPLIAETLLDGERFQRRALPLPPLLPWGYHRLSVTPGDAAASVIVTPGRCWLPQALQQGQRFWGVTVQLYTLRSAGNWGIGDYSDLRNLVDLMAPRGAGVIGLNPLHALFPDNPEHASPYSPASRLLLNILNIDVTALPELSQCAPARALLAAAEFRRRVAVARAASLVDYTAVTALKLEMLELLFETFRTGAPAARRDAFADFRRELGQVLERGCLFLALREHFANQTPELSDWRRWPEGFRDPASAAVQRFAQENARRVDFHAWLQWVADRQLANVAEAAARHRMPIGLYRDLAVGADSAGAETWAEQKAVISGVQVGAPRDIFNPAGQDWGLPPFHPRALRQEGYRSFIDLVRANMRHAGGLRIDHVMGLLHLFCIPAGKKPVDGAYIAYPMDDLIGILALESQRNSCLVVGEDLGTVPAGFREHMAAANILSYRILFFEQEEKTGAFLPPQAYPSLAMAVVGSHDLPTLRGWWEGRDIDLKQRYGLLPTDDEVRWHMDLRERDRERLLEALRGAGLLPPGQADVEAISRAAHTFLARSVSCLAVAQLDDLIDEGDQVNVPSTSWEHPNWRRKLSVPVEDLVRHAGFDALVALLRAERAGIGHG
jgi:4-alpha-glucanotransferase